MSPSSTIGSGARGSGTRLTAYGPPPTRSSPPPPAASVTAKRPSAPVRASPPLRSIGSRAAAKAAGSGTAKTSTPAAGLFPTSTRPRAMPGDRTCTVTRSAPEGSVIDPRPSRACHATISYEASPSPSTRTRPSASATASDTNTRRGGASSRARPGGGAGSMTRKTVTSAAPAGSARSDTTLASTDRVSSSSTRTATCGGPSTSSASGRNAGPDRALRTSIHADGGDESPAIQTAHGSTDMIRMSSIAAASTRVDFDRCGGTRGRAAVTFRGGASLPRSRTSTRRPHEDGLNDAEACALSGADHTRVPSIAIATPRASRGTPRHAHCTDDVHQHAGHESPLAPVAASHSIDEAIAGSPLTPPCTVRRQTWSSRRSRSSPTTAIGPSSR